MGGFRERNNKRFVEVGDSAHGIATKLNILVTG
jgi:hypothetical protein